MNLAKHIEHLLSKTDCVIVPGLGAIICHNSLARVVDGQILPPSVEVSFNSAICQNDGLLVNSVMKTEKCSYAYALNLVESEVETIKSDLRDSKQYALGNIGWFRYSESGCLVFEPCRGKNIANWVNYGLQSVDTISATSSQSVNNSKSVVKLGRKAMRIAASIAVIVVLAFTLTTPISINNNVDKASITNLPSNCKVKKSTSVKPVVEQSHKAVAKQNAAKSPNVSNDATKYYVIIASLTSVDAASKYKADFQERNCEIVNSKGSSVYKIAIASGNTREEMEKFISDNKLDEKYPGIWICKIRG